MKRKFLLRLVVCLVPTLLAALAVGLAVMRESEGNAGFRRGIDLAGGTILVYEVNLERSLRGKTPDAVAAAGTGLSGEEIRKLAENLKRRIDPADLRNVIVRPVGTTRIEIILPRSGSVGGTTEKKGATEDYVQEVKERVRQVGVLEFRIVANSTDDAAGVSETRAAIERQKTDPKVKAELEDLARRGLPPLAAPSSYSVTVNGETVADTTYQWVELGPEERDSYGLSNAYAEDRPKPKKLADKADEVTWLYPSVAEARNAEGGAFAKSGAVVAVRGSLMFTREFTKLQPAVNEETKKFEYFLLTRVSPSDATKVDRDFGMQARSDTLRLDPAVFFSFNAYGANKFGKISERNRKGDNGFKRQLAVIMDDKIVSAPSLDAVIKDSGTISGGSFDQAGVNRLVFLLRSGALNAELKPDPVSENTVGPTLGEDTIRKGLLAIGFSFVAVLAFMLAYYRFAGIVACTALTVNLLLTIGFMVTVQAAFTLPGLAGIVLMLGMAVDANVLLYERIREERAKGANLVTSIRLGYDRAFGTIIDTHLTSIFTCVVLYAFGNDNLKGFSVSLTVGLIISLFTALYMTRLMFDYAVARRAVTELKMHQLFPRPNFDFMSIRKAMFALTGTATVLGLGLFLARGDAALNVDFTKGTAYGGRLAEGQERALTDRDSRGFLTLLGEAAQRDRLKVQGVTLAASDAVEGKPDNEKIYVVAYEDGTSAVVTFANAPEGADQAAKLADVKARASQLPGLSVEQVFLGSESYPSNKSRSFTVRTTEKEPELVQVMLDRLLRDETTGAPLLASTRVTGTKVAWPTATVTLDRAASPRYFGAFLERELKLVGRWPLVGGLAGLTVTGVPTEADPAVSAEEGRSGQYKTLKVDVSANDTFTALKEATAAGKVGADEKSAKELVTFTESLDRAAKAFTARPIPDRLETFDPALAKDTRNRAFAAIVASWLAILVYLWFRFGNWTFGLAAVFCLVHDLCFTLGAIALCHYLFDNPFGQLLQLHDFKIDLIAVAALLTLVGYSVNDTIVVFDRIREVRGKNPLLTPQMINDSVNQTLSRTVLASLTVFLVVIVLYVFGGEGVHLFAFVMVIGVIVGTYSSIYIASPLLLIFGEGKPKIDPRFPNRKVEAVAAR